MYVCTKNVGKIDIFCADVVQFASMDTSMQVLKDLGLSEKLSKIYLAALEHGECSISFLAEKSGIKRTTIYELLEQLIAEGFLFKVQSGKKTLYGATSPRQILTLKRRAIEKIADEIGHLEAKHYAQFDIPKVRFYYGSTGFKNIWDEILNNTKKEYRIITNGSMFDKYVSSNYLFDEIISKRKKLGIKSKQLIVPSEYAKRIVSKDAVEDRITRFLPPDTQLEFTEVITDSLTAFMSDPEHNFQFIVQSKSFAHFRRQLFDALWDSV